MLLENLIYGTFPDLPGSQQVVHKTAGISPELENLLRRFYDNFGDCKSEDFQTSISVCWLNPDQGEPVVAVTRVSRQGRDFSGRWGALLRHTAIMTRGQYRQFFYEPTFIEPLLVLSGSSEELSNLGDLDLSPPTTAVDFLAILLDSPFADLKENLRALMNGQRLVLYSDGSNQYSNSYLRQLLHLLPFSLKQELNWSELLFRSVDSFDLSLVYSSRHEAPKNSELQFARSGKSCFAGLDLPAGYVNDYLELLETSLTTNDLDRLTDLVCDLSG